MLANYQPESCIEELQLTMVNACRETCGRSLQLTMVNACRETCGRSLQLTMVNACRETCGRSLQCLVSVGATSRVWTVMCTILLNGLRVRYDVVTFTNIMHPCSDFMDMLRRLANCHIIIIIIIINAVLPACALPREN